MANGKFATLRNGGQSYSCMSGETFNIFFFQGGLHFVYAFFFFFLQHKKHYLQNKTYTIYNTTYDTLLILHYFLRLRF